MELSEELIAKAKGTKTPEELAALAKESSIDLTEEEAKAYFEQLHPKTGELSDDELDNVAGGGCHTKGGYLLTTAGYRCGFFEEDTSPTAFGLMGTCCRCRHWTKPIGPDTKHSVHLSNVSIQRTAEGNKQDSGTAATS